MSEDLLEDLKKNHKLVITCVIIISTMNKKLNEVSSITIYN